MPPPLQPRLLFVDNLRWLMIALVVTMHAAVTFSHLGSWYYKDPAQPGAASLLVFAFLQTHLQAFFMGLLFLIAGYFVPGALERKGAPRFIADRAVRLGVPTLIYVLLVHPAVAYYLCQVTEDGPFPAPGAVARHYYLSARVLSGTGPLWFALALLGFSAAYAAGQRGIGRHPTGQRDAVLPGHGTVVASIAVIAIATFLVRIVQPIGTDVLNMQPCFFTQYVVLFSVGVAAWRRNWLLRLPLAFGRTWMILALTLGPLLWLGMMLAGGKPVDFAPYTGGWHWQSGAYCLWESGFGVAACIGLLVGFRERFNCQGQLARFLSDNAFAVYVFHTPILIALTMTLRGLAWPALAKFALSSVLGTVACFLASHLVLRRIPGLQRVL